MATEPARLINELVSQPLEEESFRKENEEWSWISLVDETKEVWIEEIIDLEDVNGRTEGVLLSIVMEETLFSNWIAGLRNNSVFSVVVPSMDASFELAVP